MAHVYVDSTATGAGTGADWANAYTTLAAAFAAKAAGDNFWVAENHAETQATALTLTCPGTAASPCTVMCVNSAGSVPPVSADLATTATISTTGANAITLGAGVAYVYGVAFRAGSAASNASVNTGAQGFWILKNCNLSLNNTSGSSSMNFSGDATSATLILDNTTMTFGSVAQDITIGSGSFTWKNTASAIDGSVPTTLIGMAGTRAVAPILIEGVDLSAAGSGKTLVGDLIRSGSVTFKDCKLGADVTVATAFTNAICGKIFVVNSDSSGTNYRHEKYEYAGQQVVDTTLYRTGGASDGTTPLSWKITATANAKWVLNYESIQTAIWNDTTAANVTVTVEGLQDPRTSTALPNNDDIWMELTYMGSSATPVATFNSGTKADYLATGSALTASTQAWDSGITARANSTAYALGDSIKVASNSGRVFICTTAGTTAGSEPAGYASAVDGGAVTDNTATFTAAVRFKQAITLSSPQPAQAGPIYATIKVGKASGIFYIDPKLVLS